jgi:hypothetical protein
MSPIEGAGLAELRLLSVRLAVAGLRGNRK